MIATFKELQQKWGDIERDKLSFDEELTYVNDWYDLGKNLPTKPFDPNFTDYNKYKGQNFTIEGTVSHATDGVVLENLPMWKIKMPDGEILWADCSEIFDWEKIENE
jgi:hypothetical protein